MIGGHLIGVDNENKRYFLKVIYPSILYKMRFYFYFYL